MSNIVQGKQILNRRAYGLLTRSFESNLDLAQGLFNDQYQVSKFGYAADIDIVDGAVDIWNTKGTYTGQPTGSPETLSIASTSADDTSAGSGMQTMRIYGLHTSSDTTESNELITLTGTTPVVTTSTWYRVYRCVGESFGAGGSNAGAITVNHSSTTANVFANVPVGLGQTVLAAYTIPASVKGYLANLYIVLSRASGAAGSALVSVRKRTFGSGGYVATKYYSVTTSVPIHPMSPLYTVVCNPKDDIKIRVESVSDNDSIVTAEFDLHLIRQ